MHRCIVGSNCKIGKNCILEEICIGNDVMIPDGTKITNRHSVIANGASEFLNVRTKADLFIVHFFLLVILFISETYLIRFL